MINAIKFFQTSFLIEGDSAYSEYSLKNCTIAKLLLHKTTRCSLFFKKKILNFLFVFKIWLAAVLPTMIKRKQGRIVCVSSVQGKFSLPHRSAYAASKHALNAFCDSLRAEVAEHNVSVLCVSPGYINTALSLNALTSSGRSYGS